MNVSDEASQTDDAQMRAALDAMPHKVWMVRPEGPALYYNRAMRAFAGEALNLPDRASREQALVHPDDLAISGLQWRARLQTPRTSSWRYACSTPSARGAGIG